jgi:Tfp pilus assembly protein PilX
MSTRRNEEGAILVLALIFMVVTALIVTGLLAFAGNDIVNAGNLQTSRSALYASDGAIQVAMWNMRYTFPSSTAAGFCPSQADQPSTDPFTPNGQSLDGQSIYVWCGGITVGAQSRSLTFYAYPASNCQATCTGNAYIQAHVTYNDLGGTQSGSNNMQYLCSSTSTATCGTGMTVDSWVVEPGLS